MKVTGIQKLTLLDYPGVVACTVFTAGCNFRCPFYLIPQLLHTSQKLRHIRMQQRLAACDGNTVEHSPALFQKAEHLVIREALVVYLLGKNEHRIVTKRTSEIAACREHRARDNSGIVKKR